MTAGRLLVHAALALLVIAAVAVRESAPAAAQQQTPPTFLSAMVDGVTVTLIYSQGLNPSPGPAGTDYTVLVNSSGRNVDGVSISGPRVKLTLASAVVASDAVVVSYTPGPKPVMGWGGSSVPSPVVSLSNRQVANNTALCENEAVIANHAAHPDLVADCKVLWGMRETLEGDSNISRWLNWGSTRSLSDWDGVAGIGGNPRRVTAFVLDASDGSTQFRGDVPAALANLPGLVTLEFNQQQLNGVIPAELGDLPKLKTLKLSYSNLGNPATYDSLGNRLEEPGIPSELGRLKETLEVLDLGGNNLGGDIPSEIWDLTELRSLRLHGNSITGTIPSEIKNLTQLQRLVLHGNQFTGSIPTEIGLLTELTILTMYGNGFTGPIPAELSSLTKLGTLHLHSNQLTGSIPASLERLAPATPGDAATLRYLQLFNDGLTGCIPAKLFNVLYNDLDFIEEYLELPRCASGTPTNTRPAISSAIVDGATLTLTYSEPLDTSSQPDASNYTVSVNRNGSTTDVDVAAAGVSISGRTITLTLDAPVVASDVVLLTYTPGSPPDSNPVQDTDGADAAQFADREVTNNTMPAPPVFESGSVNRDVLILTYSEDLDTSFGWEATPYEVTADGTTHTVSLVEISGTGVTLTLSSPVLGGQEVRLSYAPPQTDPLQDLTGEDAAALTRELIANNTGLPPALDKAEVDRDILTLTYNKALDDTSQPAVAAYTVKVGGTGRTVDSAVVDGSTVTLTLDSPVTGGQTVLLSYAPPQTDPLQDLTGEGAAAFTDKVITNITNNAPTFTTTSPAFTVAENTREVGTIAADDVDTQDTVHTYILKPANLEDDGQRFTITNAGLLKFKDVNGADYEHSGAMDDSNDYLVTVMATSGSGTRERMTTEQITVTVTTLRRPAGCSSRPSSRRSTPRCSRPWMTRTAS